MPGGLDLGALSATVPQDIDESGLGASYFRLLYTKMQAQLAPIKTGTFAARPAPGNAGMVYVATDVDVVYVDSGSTWKRAITGTGATTAEIADLQVTAAKIALASITAAQLAGSLKPSGSAATSDEALRAIGTGSGQVAAGGSHTFSGNLGTGGNLSVSGTASVTGNATMSGTLGVSGVSTLSGGAVIPFNINAQTGTSYTLVAGDASKLVTLDNASAVTVTVPNNSTVPFATGTAIEFIQKGVGQVSFAGAGGVTIGELQSKTKLAGQWAWGTIVKLDTNTWVLTGALAS